MARSSTTESTTLKKEEEEEDESRPPALKKEEEEEDESRPPAEVEDTGSQVAPIVKLLEVAVTIGEENEDVLLHLKAELYRYDQEGDQLKERGVGDVKLLKHKETGKVRLVMRQNKTLKIYANHSVLPTMSIQEHHGNETSCVWEAADFADEELKKETFCIRFGSVESSGFCPKASHPEASHPVLSCRPFPQGALLNVCRPFPLGTLLNGWGPFRQNWKSTLLHY